MRIAVCDDDLTHAQITMKNVKELITKHNNLNFELEFLLYTDGNLMLTEHDISPFDVVFLDIEMPDIDGFEVADKMFIKNTDIFIIYTTSYDSYLRQSIKHRVYRFVSKGDVAELEDSIIQLFNDLAIQNTFYSFKYKRNLYNLEVNSILYCMQSRNLMLIHTESEIYKQIISIKKILNVLPNYFLRCHSSYIVNTKKITETNLDKIILKSKVEIPIGRSYRQDVHHYFASHYIWF